MATLAVREVTRAGTVPAPVSAAAGGDKFAPSKDTWLRVANGSGASINVTITTPNTLISDVPITDVVVAVGAGVTKEIGPFPYEHFANSADGLADVAYSAVTTVTVEAVKTKQN